MPDTHSLQRGRLVANGLASPWTFFPIAFVFALFVVNSVGPTWWRLGRSSTAGWANLALFVVLLACWYFGVSRIPDRVRVGAVRKQAPDAAVVCGVRLDNAGLEWAAGITSEQNDVRLLVSGAVLVVARDGIHLWGGPAREPVTVLDVPWSSIESLSVVHSLLHGARVAFQMQGEQNPATFKVANRRLLGTMFERAQTCELLTEEIKQLRP
jgi:hypothetical protein